VGIPLDNDLGVVNFLGGRTRRGEKKGTQKKRGKEVKDHAWRADSVEAV
jgi:hypothetical protein